MQPNDTPTNLKTWEGFQARKATKAAGASLPAAPVTPERLEARLTESIREAQARMQPKAKRTPKPPVEAKPVLLADVLRQAVALAVARRERVARDVAVREQTLLEVLTDAMRGAQ